MATRTEVLTKKRNEHLLAKATLATAMAISAVGGTIWVASGIKYTENPAPSFSLPKDEGDFPKLSGENVTLPAKEKPINKVPLAQVTKERGGMFMVPNAGLSREFPTGYSLSFQDGTIVDIEKDEVNNIMWVALAMPGDKLTKEDTKNTAKNYDGSQTELFGYKGFTAWFKIDRSVASFLNGAKWGGGIEQLDANLKLGKPASFYVVLDQYSYNKKYELMDINSLSLLNKETGKPNLDRSDTEFRFKADYVFYNTK